MKVPCPACQYRTHYVGCTPCSRCAGTGEVDDSCDHPASARVFDYANDEERCGVCQDVLGFGLVPAV